MERGLLQIIMPHILFDNSRAYPYCKLWTAVVQRRPLEDVAVRAHVLNLEAIQRYATHRRLDLLNLPNIVTNGSTNDSLKVKSQ